MAATLESSESPAEPAASSQGAQHKPHDMAEAPPSSQRCWAGTACSKVKQALNHTLSRKSRKSHDVHGTRESREVSKGRGIREDYVRISYRCGCCGRKLHVDAPWTERDVHRAFARRRAGPKNAYTVRVETSYHRYPPLWPPKQQ
ncbi:hypothetical protein NKR23_g2026 [Pleurostoma richardsiae]|uniref:Uncharacterized protein n=1 Tax=Pleurostoma richardsiae TaxID=41990 RepID=A0AA38VVS8_9PEZI|nr:hypothetical protein NKR23_g2026 [Pleurostoma richardsiae]